MGRRNPIHVVGEPIRTGVTWLSDDLIRAGAHDKALGSDGFVLLAYLLSCATSPGSSDRVWETSEVQIATQFGWPGNRRRVAKAVDAAVKDDRLILREYIRDGAIVSRRRAYVVCAGGRRFTDAERFHHSTPIELQSKPTTSSGNDL